MCSKSDLGRLKQNIETSQDHAPVVVEMGSRKSLPRSAQPIDKDVFSSPKFLKFHDLLRDADHHPKLV